jgi:hypothetical protein
MYCLFGFDPNKKLAYFIDIIYEYQNSIMHDF